jgi:hypothetical protein
MATWSFLEQRRHRARLAEQDHEWTAELPLYRLRQGDPRTTALHPVVAGLIRYRPDQRGIGPLAPLQPLLSWKERRLDDFAERVEIAAAG